MKKIKRSQILFRLDDKVKNKFNTICDKIDRTHSEVLRDLLFKFVIEHNHLLEEEEEN